MPFVEQEEGYEDHVIDGKPVKVYKPRVEVTIKHLRTGQDICRAPADRKSVV